MHAEESQEGVGIWFFDRQDSAPTCAQEDVLFRFELFY